MDRPGAALTRGPGARKRPAESTGDAAGRSLLAYVGWRLAGTVPMALAVATLVFALVHLAPGDAADVLVDPRVPQSVVAQIRANYGLDQPLPVQYVRWMGGLARGDLGYSFTHNRPVASILAEVLPNTLLLAGLALVIAFTLGVFVGVVQAVRQNSALDSVLSIVALVFYSMPEFLLGLFLMLVFAFHAPTAGWPVHFPASGVRSLDYGALGAGGRILDRLYHLVLPVTTLALVLTAGVSRYVRGSMLEVIRQDFIRTARAKGLPERTVIWKHALRNALSPVITLLGLALPLLFGGTVLIEQVFGWPGMGKTMVDAIGQRDQPVILAVSLLFALLVVVGNLVADILYAIVDPRVRHE